MTERVLVFKVNNLPETAKAALEKEGVLTDRPLNILDLTEMSDDEFLAFMKRTGLGDYLLDLVRKYAAQPKREREA